ncbi:MAG TPA: xylulokinase [Acidobacteriota bacterium]|nr:xylulokinase [Acidobacteriota bacterium]
MPQYAIGIDSGTQGTKALVVDVGSGRVIGRGKSPHAMIEGLGPGASEQDPAVWVEATEKALAGALKEARAGAGNVVAIGVSGQQHGFVPLDVKGEVIRPAKLWNDTSTIRETEDLVAALGGGEAAIARLGISPAVGFTASKILWLKRHEPKRFARLATVLLPHNYLNYWLTGRAHMEYGDASGTGLMDIRRLRWDDQATAAIDPGLAAKLPPLSHPSEPVGDVRKRVAERFGFGRVLVASGGGDNMMGAIGSGNVTPGVCTLSLGTSGTVYSHFDRPFVDPEGEVAAFCDSTGGWLPLLCTMNVTNTTEIVKSLFGLDNAKLERLARRAGAGADGLLFLPFVDGERVPALPSSSAVFLGLDRRTFDAAHIVRAVMEGTVLNLGYGFARMRALGLKPSEIRATGGGAKSRLWLQIAADVFRTPVVTLRETEAAAYGAALQSVWNWRLAKGEKTDIAAIAAKWVAKDKLAAEPDPKSAALYADLQARFNDLWRRLVPDFEARRKTLAS